MRSRWSIVIGFWSIIFFFFSCSLSHYPNRVFEKGYFVDKEQVMSDSVGLKICYTGAGGMAIDYKNQVLLTDPFYSNTSLSKVMFGKIATKPVDVRLAFQKLQENKINLRNTKGVLVAHSHYDHLLDLPYLFTQNLIDTTKTMILGSRSTKNILQKFVPEKHLKAIEDSTFYHFGKKQKRYGWFQISENLRVLPIEAKHAAHFKVLGVRFKFLNGNVESTGIKNFTTPLSKTKSTHWKEGGTFSYLVDVVEKEQILKRIFIQTSSCNHPFGFPPEAEIQKKKVDIAILGVASANMVRGKDYPDNHITYLKPSTIVLVHWEDFFRDYAKNLERPKTVAITNFKAFFKKIEHVNTDKVLMPKPGVTMKW